MLEIITEPNPILHQKTQRVLSVDKKIVDIVREMQIAMKLANGIGLAAPQVSLNQQIAIVQIPDRGKTEGEEVDGPLIAMINPKITNASPQVSTEMEGCLSIPNVEVSVTRPVSVRVKFTDLDSKIVTLDANGLMARAIQHEIDHLNGILITDHGKAQPIKEND